MVASRRGRGAWLAALAGMLALAAAGCGRDATPIAPAGTPVLRPSILLVTLDTTRADAVGPDAKGVSTPAFNALAARSLRFTQAYAPVPETLPSHVSMLTGLYAAGHGVHENGRTLAGAHAVAAELVQKAGYRTAAFVSSFTLARRFGLARGFEVYDDVFPAGAPERSARETTDAATAYLQQGAAGPRFVWVHYFDPHAPYTPPEPFRSRYATAPYLGEVAAMDEQLGRLIQVFEAVGSGPKAIIVAADHGEGLGEHGESFHGNLLYQSTVHVPLLVCATGITPGPRAAPVSTRRVFHTVLDLAGVAGDGSLRTPVADVPLGEAMKPFLNYGWQPQIMAVDGVHKTILAGRAEIFDVAADPGETRDLMTDPAARVSVPPAARDYPVPSVSVAQAPEALDPQARRELASLGYISAVAAPVVRKGAPRPIDMAGLFDVMDRASGLFVAERYAEVIPFLERILAADPSNLDAMLRMATAHSVMGRREKARALFERAIALAPESPDVRMYLGLHYARGPEWQQAARLLEAVLAASPDRVAAIEALAAIREREQRATDVVVLLQRLRGLRALSAGESARLGRAAMATGQTDVAIGAFEEARKTGGPFNEDLELGVLYLAARRFPEARDSLDRVQTSHHDYAMALFKRAQVSVLLNEPDAAARIDRARRGASPETRPLIARERLFQGR
jgi:arylsulfatase A-like enzyme/tetratricopeptide (TPR) repeat protein